MISVQTALVKEVGDFFHNAWETVINAIAGKWGDVLIIGPDGKLVKAIVAKGAFSTACEFTADSATATVTVTEHPVERFTVIAVRKDTGSVVCATSIGSEVSFAVEPGKEYLLFMNGQF